MPKMSDPVMRRHKRRNADDTAYIVLNGKQIYLGSWGTPEARERCDRVVGEWRCNGRTLPAAHGDITVAELVERYIVYCRNTYTPESAVHFSLKSALGPMVRLYGSLPAAQFGPKKLKTVRGAIVEAGIAKKRPYTRSGVNSLTGVIRRMFKWAVSEELVAHGAYASLKTIEPLRRGKCNLPDRPPVQPVSLEDLQAADPHLNASTRALMWLMWHTGARCSELVRLTPEDIDRSGALWKIVLVRHKTSDKTGVPRVVYVGPNGQASIREMLVRRHDDEYLFQPSDHFEKVRQRSVCPRRPDQKPNPRKTERGINESYDTNSFRKALGHACREAGIPAFTPHRIRHAAATRIRAELGLEHAQAVLGHLTIDATQLYAAVADSRARDAMAGMG